MGIGELSSSDVCEAAGITYRQLDHWTRLGVVDDPREGFQGSGVPRRWTRRQATVLAVLGKLVVLGSRPSQLREAAALLLELPADRWATTTLYVGLDGTVSTAPPGDAGQYVRLGGYSPGD